MAALAIEIADLALAAVRGDALVASSDCVALLDPAGVIVGDAAAARLQPMLLNDRYWAELDTEPLPRPAPGAGSHADLAFLHLRQLFATCGADAEAVLFAVPSTWRERELGLLWGIAAAAGLPVQGCVDAAVAACASLAAQPTVLHLDVGLHQSTLAEMDGQQLLRRRRVDVAPRASLKSLRGRWAQVVAEAMVRRTRFDPLHNAASEQLLHEHLPAWLEQARSGGRADAALDFGGRRFAVEIGRDEFALAAEAWYTQLVDLVRAGRRSGEPVTLALSHRAAALPGLAERFAAEHDLALSSLPVGAAAFGAVAHRAAIVGDGLPALVTALERNVPPLVPTPRRRAGARPTHLVHDGVAHTIGGAPLLVGTAPAAATALTLPPGLPGVSRRHCAVLAQGADIVVRDMSRHGTFLNGERVTGEAPLCAGDRLRVGAPGVVLELVAVA